jgi:hypothetical protein
LKTVNFDHVDLISLLHQPETSDAYQRLSSELGFRKEGTAITMGRAFSLDATKLLPFLYERFGKQVRVIQFFKIRLPPLTTANIPMDGGLSCLLLCHGPARPCSLTTTALTGRTQVLAFYVTRVHASMLHRSFLGACSLSICGCFPLETIPHDQELGEEGERFVQECQLGRLGSGAVIGESSSNSGSSSKPAAASDPAIDANVRELEKVEQELRARARAIGQ